LSPAQWGAIKNDYSVPSKSNHCQKFALSHAFIAAAKRNLRDQETCRTITTRNDFHDRAKKTKEAGQHYDPGTDDEGCASPARIIHMEGVLPLPDDPVSPKQQARPHHYEGY